MSEKPMTSERLKEIKKRERLASDGKDGVLPWSVRDGRSGWPAGLEIVMGLPGGSAQVIALGLSPADAAFIAWARQDIPDLLAEVRRQAAEIASLSEDLTEALDVARHLATGHRACSPGCDWWARVENVRKST